MIKVIAYYKTGQVVPYTYSSDNESAYQRMIRQLTNNSKIERWEIC